MTDMLQTWLVISCGEVDGVGYELAIKTVELLKKKNTFFIPILIGNFNRIKFVTKKLSSKFLPILVTPDFIISAKYIALPIDKYLLINVDVKNANNTSLITFKTLEETVKLVKEFVSTNTKFGLLTMPVSKKNLQKTIPDFIGHTEYFAKKFNVNNISMLMEGKDEKNNVYNVLMLTRHIPLREVSKSLSKENIIKQLENTVRFINKYEHKKIQLVIFCNLNPHGGDDGLIGNEDKKIILDTAKKISVKLKLKTFVVNNAADAFNYVKKNKNKKILIVCNYHDQAMLPLKLLCNYKIVNITVGLPFFRVSPGHGVAKDIVLKNKVDISGVEFCIEKLHEFLCHQ